MLSAGLAVVVLVVAVAAVYLVHRQRATEPASAPSARFEPASFVDSALPPDRRPDPYAGLPDDHLLAPAPRVATAGGGSAVLADWLRHHTGRDGVWQEVVSEMYGRVTRVPAIAEYFIAVDMTKLQRHFLAALVILTGRGLTVSTLRRMSDAHAAVRDSAGQPITGDVFDAVVSTLAGILDEYRVPPATVRQVGAVVAPLRVVIAADPDPAVR